MALFNKKSVSEKNEIASYLNGQGKKMLLHITPALYYNSSLSIAKKKI